MKRYMAWFVALLFYASSLPVMAVDYWKYNASDINFETYGLMDNTYKVAPGWINVKAPPYAAVGDNTADDTAAIQAAHDALPATGGMLIVPSGVYRITSTITFTKKIHILGVGTSEMPHLTSTGGLGATVFLKDSALNGPVFVFDGAGWGSGSGGSSMEHCVVDGEPGNGGNGINILATNVTLRNVSVFNQGNDGIRIGQDATGVNANSFLLDKVTSSYNDNNGVYIHDETGGLPDANAGTTINLFVQNNAFNGLVVGNSYYNTFVGTLAETNTGYGIVVKSGSLGNVFVGGDSNEGNDGGNFVIESGAVDTQLYGHEYGTSFSDAGTNSVWFGKHSIKIPASATGAILTNGNGPTFADNDAYISISADSDERIRFGYSNKSVETGLDTAQVIADTSTLRLITRDVDGATIDLRAGSGLPTVATVDNTSITVSTGKVFSITDGGTETIGAGVGSIKMGNDNAATNSAWIPMKYNGTTYYIPAFTTPTP